MAFFPSRINEIPITFSQLDRTVAIDPDFNEPIGDDVTLSTSVTVNGQINFKGGPFRRRANTLSGDESTIDGHAVFRLDDLADSGLVEIDGNGDITFVISKGDRITKVNGVSADLEIMEIRPESPLRGEFLLIYIEFTQHSEDSSGIPRL